MKKILASVLSLQLLWLCGCSASQDASDLQRQYAALCTADMEADVTCHLDGESRAYRLSCAVSAEGARVAVLEPELLRGVEAEVTPDGLTVTYDGVMLPAGELDDICPANCLPYLLKALAEGYVLEESREEFDGVPCLRLALDTTAHSGEKVVCTAWIGREDLLPRYAEFTQQDKTVLTVTMRAFSCTIKEV